MAKPRIESLSTSMRAPTKSRISESVQARGTAVATRTALTRLRLAQAYTAAELRFDEHAILLVRSTPGRAVIPLPQGVRGPCR